MRKKFAKRSIEELGKLGITEYAILAMTTGEALVVDRRVLQYRQGARRKLAMANQRFGTYEDAVKAVRLAHHRETAVFSVRTHLRGMNNEWNLLPGTRSQSVFLEGGVWWVRFPGDVEMVYNGVASSPDLFERLHIHERVKEEPNDAESG